VIAHFYHFLLLAEAEATNAVPAAGQQSDPNALPRLLGMILITGILFYFIMLRPQKKKEQDVRDRVNNLKENERVVTIGGIHGVVTNVQREQERVTIRVDEATGTKLRINMSAIARVVTGDEDNAAASGNKS
jgi:preprotein translocase subunit YajC